jgi:septal ring factor EnvC (AmiA/AmiB activator)
MIKLKRTHGGKQMKTIASKRILYTALTLFIFAMVANVVQAAHAANKHQMFEVSQKIKQVNKRIKQAYKELRKLNEEGGEGAQEQAQIIMEEIRELKADLTTLKAQLANMKKNVRNTGYKEKTRTSRRR